MPADLLTEIAAARKRLQAAEDALTEATAGIGDRGTARASVDAARAELGKAREQVLGSEPGFALVGAEHPLLLLPVRLETRYADGPFRLRVRIYPDDIHADSHEPALSADERKLQLDFLKRLATGFDQDWLPAWRELARRLGPLRALWLATGSSSVLRPPGWTRAARARCLPDRFVAFAWTAGGGPVRVQAPRLVREPLPLGPDPMRDDAGTGQPLGADARWLHDFSAALDAGMALEIPLQPGDRVTRVVVIGVRSTVDPANGAAEFARLLDAHRCTDGLSLLAPGAPTHALLEQRSAYQAQPDADELYRDELGYRDDHGRVQRRAVSWEASGHPFAGQEAAGFRLDRAFGLKPGTLGRLAGSDDDWAGQERLLRDVLASVAADGLERLLTPAVSPESIDPVLKFMRQHVSAGGPFATLRVGAQPYGVLPVRLAGRMDPGSEPDGLASLLDRLRTEVFEPALSDVLRVSVPRPADPEMVNPGRRLLEMLRLDAHTRTLGVRALLDPRLLAAVLPSMNATDRSTIDSARQRIRALLAALGDLSPQTTAIGNAGLFEAVAPVALRWVGDASEVAQLRALRMPDFYDPHPALPVPLTTTELLDGWLGPPRPATLLFELGRQAILLTADRAARQWLEQSAQAQGLPAPDFDNPTGILSTLEARLRAPSPSDSTVSIAFQLDYGNVNSVPAGTDFIALRRTLGQLAGIPPARLEAVLAAVLGLLTHRLDAWYTALASARLDPLRIYGVSAIGNEPPVKQGLNLGAFGWLDAFPAGGARGGAGWVHAPSTQHALTAAVLLSTDKAHRTQGHGDAFAIDLSSARVRGAAELLEGLRAGQPLGALLGYRIERALAQTAPALTARVRALAPLVANKREPSGSPAETVAADNVVDGLALLKLAGHDGTSPPEASRLTALDRTAQEALAPILADAADRIDAVADLLLADAVHHAVAGSPVRAGAAADLLAGAPVGVPDEIEITRIGQRGLATTHSVLLLFEADPPAPAGWNATPRAEAEPALEAWLAQQLPDPAAVAVAATFSRGDGSAASVETTLGALLSSAMPLRGLGAVDAVLLPPSALERRIAALLEPLRPEGCEGAPTLDTEAAPGGNLGDWSLAALVALAQTLRRLLGGARGLQRADFGAWATAAGASLDTADLDKRLSALRAAVLKMRDELTAATRDEQRLAALQAAELLGIDAVPSVGVLAAAVTTVRQSLERRIAESDDPSRPTVERMRSLGGPELVGVPRLSVVGTGWSAPWAQDLGADAADLRAFIARATGVRDPVARLDAVLANGEALAGSGTALHRLSLAQHPRAPGDRWTGLAGTPSPSRMSFVVAHPPALDPAASGLITGLFIDAWTEVVPQSEVDTAVVFDAQAASQAAPNAMLLLVPESSRNAWNEDDVRDHVLEALALTRLRAVDPDLVARAGQLLPAMPIPDADGGGGTSLSELWSRPPTP